MVDGEASINNVNKIFPRYTSLVPKGHSHMTSVELWKFGTPPSALSHFKQPTFINTINQQSGFLHPRGCTGLAFSKAHGPGLFEQKARGPSRAHGPSSILQIGQLAVFSISYSGFERGMGNAAWE